MVHAQGVDERYLRRAYGVRVQLIRETRAVTDVGMGKRHRYSDASDSHARYWEEIGPQPIQRDGGLVEGGDRQFVAAALEQAKLIEQGQGGADGELDIHAKLLL